MFGPCYCQHPSVETNFYCISSSSVKKFFSLYHNIRMILNSIGTLSSWFLTKYSDFLYFVLISVTLSNRLRINMLYFPSYITVKFSMILTSPFWPVALAYDYYAFCLITIDAESFLHAFVLDGKSNI